MPGVYAQSQEDGESESPLETQTNDSNLIFPDDGINICPEQDRLTKGNVLSFLTKASWEDNRQETGTVGVTSTQLEVLSDNDGQDKVVCDYLHNEFFDTITKTWDDGGKMYDIAFYKAGSFYFVSIVVAQPADQNRAAIGLSFIDVFDQNLNHRKGYSF